MLKRLPPGTKLEGMDEEMALWLIDRHPRRGDKVGAGIKEIKIERPQKWGKGCCLFIYRIDGSRIDFSYRKALAGREPGKLEYFRMACRTAVEIDIIKFKKEALASDPICRYRGVRLWQDNSHVDHVKPRTFNWLVDNFLCQTGLNLDDVEIVGDVKRQFRDKRIALCFLDYHRDMACLELVSAEANQCECKTTPTTLKPKEAG